MNSNFAPCLEELKFVKYLVQKIILINSTYYGNVSLTGKTRVITFIALTISVLLLTFNVKCSPLSHYS